MRQIQLPSLGIFYPTVSLFFPFCLGISSGGFIAVPTVRVESLARRVRPPRAYLFRSWRSSLTLVVGALFNHTGLAGLLAEPADRPLPELVDLSYRFFCSNPRHHGNDVVFALLCSFDRCLLFANLPYSGRTSPPFSYDKPTSTLTALDASTDLSSHCQSQSAVAWLGPVCLS